MVFEIPKFELIKPVLTQIERNHPTISLLLFKYVCFSLVYSRNSEVGYYHRPYIVMPLLCSISRYSTSKVCLFAVKELLSCFLIFCSKALRACVRQAGQCVAVVAAKNWSELPLFLYF